MVKAERTKIALIQMRCGPKPEKNFIRAVEFIRDAAKKGGQIVCLPELFRSQYFCQTEDHKYFELAEEVPGRSTSALGELACELGIVIIASLFEKRSAGVYHNTAAIIGADGELLGKYRKMHIPDDPLYHEKFYFTPGDLGFRAWPTANGKIGVCVCWDQWYPEAARLRALRGAEIIQRGHAIANGCYVAAANRVGHEAPAGGDGIEFWGQSFIGGPSGEIVAKGSVDQEEIVMADVEWNRVNEHRTHWPFLRDRRVDAYDGLEQRMID